MTLISLSMQTKQPMARHKTFSSLSKALRARGVELENGVTALVRKASLTGLGVVSLGTPVDTSRARSNWQTSIGAPAGGVREPIGEGAAQKVIERGSSVIAAWKVGRGSIFLTNNLSYIVPLDEGSSAQAPAGMSSSALLAMRQTVGKPSRIFKRR